VSPDQWSMEPLDADGNRPTPGGQNSRLRAGPKDQRKFCGKSEGMGLTTAVGIMLPHRKREADMPPHILTVFNQLFEELKSMKQQQWTITNYGLLILAAIYAVKLSGLPHSQTYLKILAGATAVLGSSFLLWVQYNMVGTRWRLDTVHKKFFTSSELEAIGWTDKEIWKLQYRPWRRKLAYWCRGLEFTVPLILVLLVGAILVCFAL